ncbi:MAG: hypothetical protein SNJ59_17005 [Aggregatilineales bacterium]
MSEVSFKLSDVFAALKSVMSNPAWDAAITTLEGLAPAGCPLPLPLPPNLADLQAQYNTLLSQFTAAQNTIAELTAVQPVDPNDVLKQIAQAINQAETLLNQQSLVIASGTIETDLYVKVGNVAGAETKITFHITPRPYS